jgi:predicted DNA-binding WGR domain protein
MSKPVPNEIYLVFVNTLANSNKFWKAKANDNGDLEITWGRVGYNGQTKVHECGSHSAALYELHTLAAKKKQKGYKESVLDSKFLEEKQVYRALELLRQLRSGNYYDYTATINEYLSLVPTPLGTQIDPCVILSRLPEINRHEQLLRGLLPKVEVAPAKQETAKAISLKGLSNLFWKLK